MRRTFVAIQLPEALAAPPSIVPEGARAVPASQLHLTLKFAGNLDKTAFARLAAELAKISAPAFALTITGAGVFPPKGAPHVLSLVLDPSPALSALRDAVEAAAIDAGLPADERPFSPHVTLARLKDVKRPALKAALAELGARKSPPVSVSAFALYSSYLSNTGATHKLEASYPLRDSPA